MLSNSLIPQNITTGTGRVLPAIQLMFEEAIKSERDVLIDIILKSHHQTITDLSKKGIKYQIRATKSTLMSGNIKGMLYDHFGDNMKESKSGRYYFYKKGEFLLLFKKLNSSYMPTNIKTKNSGKILNQLPIDFQETLPIVFIGYSVSTSWEYIEKISAVYIANNKVEWVSNLLEIGSNLQSQQNLFSPNQEESSPTNIIVKPKRSNRGKTSIG